MKNKFQTDVIVMFSYDDVQYIFYNYERWAAVREELKLDLLATPIQLPNSTTPSHITEP